MPLTRIQLVDQALEQAGLDTGFRAKGRMWLNIVLEKLSARTNYRFNRASVDTSFTANTSRYALPADFQRIDTLYYVDANGNQGNMIRISEPYEAEQARTSASGAPQVAWVDDEQDELVFNSAPGTVNGEKFRMSYFKTPATYSLDATDDSQVVDFDDQWTLLEEVKALAYEFAEDEREMQKKAEAKESSRDFQRNMYQSDANSKVDLNAELFRPTRRRY